MFTHTFLTGIGIPVAHLRALCLSPKPFESRGGENRQSSTKRFLLLFVLFIVPDLAHGQEQGPTELTSLLGPLGIMGLSSLVIILLS